MELSIKSHHVADAEEDAGEYGGDDGETETRAAPPYAGGGEVGEEGGTDAERDDAEEDGGDEGDGAESLERRGSDGRAAHDLHEESDQEDPAEDEHGHDGCQPHDLDPGPSAAARA